MLLLQGFNKNAKIPTSGQVLDVVLTDFLMLLSLILLYHVYKYICLM